MATDLGLIYSTNLGFCFSHEEKKNKDKTESIMKDYLC